MIRNMQIMSGRGIRGRGRPPLAGRGRGGSRVSSRADSPSFASMPVAVPAADAVPLLSMPSGHHGSEAGSTAPPPPPAVPAAAVPAAALAQPPAGVDYH